ncbi:MAG: hypothetical protein ACD_66C00077G0004 [uncultured bacterium]|nr:MAG: hypothetical protein ACD_66C00077G0004 [uncultured bacterium]
MSGDIIFIDTDTGQETRFHEYHVAKEEVTMADARFFGKAYKELLKGKKLEQLDLDLSLLNNLEVIGLVRHIADQASQLRGRLSELEPIPIDQILKHSLSRRVEKVNPDSCGKKINGFGSIEIILPDEDYQSTLGRPSMGRCNELACNTQTDNSLGNVPYILRSETSRGDEGVTQHETSHQLFTYGGLSLGCIESNAYSKTSFIGFRDEIIARMVYCGDGTLRAYDNIAAKYKDKVEKEESDIFNEVEKAQKELNAKLSDISFFLKPEVQRQDLILWAMTARSYKELNENMSYIFDRYCNKPQAQQNMDGATVFPNGWSKA